MRKTDIPRVRRLLSALWRSGLLQIRPRDILPILRAWWRCRNSFAFLSAAAAIRWPHRLALHDDQGALSFAQLHAQSLGLAHRLLTEAGVGPDSQVALVCSNHRGFVLGMLACTRVGADVLPLGPDLPTGVMDRIVQRQGIDHLLCEPALQERLSSCSVSIPHWTWLAGAAETTEEPAPVTRGGELIVLTSGTSGIAKGIRRRPTLGQLLPLVAGLLESLRVRIHRPIVLAIPLYHGYGIATLAMALAMGSSLQLAGRYEVAPLLSRLRGEDEPFLVTVPTLLKRWLASGSVHRRPLPAAVVTGSAPLDAGLCAELLAELGPVLFNLYGSSEAGLISLAMPETLRQAPGSVGRPLPGNSVQVVDAQGEEVARGATGQILARGPFVLPSRPDGWRDTGDLGRWDEHGNLFVCGRADSMIVSGGENVYPHEVEAVLAGHPDVAEAVVWAVSDQQFGQRLQAAVAPRPNASLEEAVLREWLKERLERHKMPRELRVLESIPKNPLGKVDRLELERRAGL